jgi:hypothetical protein
MEALGRVVVDIKSLGELRQADERTLRFAALGLALGGMLRPEDAAVFQQETVSQAELVPTVPESTRNTFERLRLLFSYGVLCYEIFTAVEDLAHLVIEHALRERFLAFYGGVVPMEDEGGQLHLVEGTHLDELFEQIRKVSRLRGTNRRRLRLRRTGELIRFDGMLDSLLRWARGEGLLRGQRSRMDEPFLKLFRNRIAHGAGDHLLMPVDAARTLSDLAEIINQLWGSATPGGRLYPAPIAREVQVVGWGAGAVASGPVGDSYSLPDRDDWTYVLVRAVPHDPGLMRFDAQHETTTYPCDLLWGPGTWQDAVTWLKGEQPQPDQVDVLDRLFLVQHHENRMHLPRSPDVAAGLAEEERDGRWHLVRADSPEDALRHARHQLADPSFTPRKGACPQCAADSLGAGTWQEMIDLSAHSGITISPCQPPDVKVTTVMGWPRYYEVSYDKR